MFFTTYETTNLINNKIYNGVHRTQDLSDEYLGSGVALKASIKKNGKHNFSKIVTGVWRTEEISYLIESWIVDIEFINRKDTYNIHVGGSGGDRFYKNKWDKQSIRAEAKKYNIQKDFVKYSKGAFNAAYNIGILEEVCLHMKKVFKFDEQKLRNILKNYTKDEFTLFRET